MTQILVTKPGILNQRDKAKLRRAGIVTVEADNPADVKLIAASGAEISPGDMLFAAISAIGNDRYSGNTQDAFAKALLSAMEHARAEFGGDQ